MLYALQTEGGEGVFVNSDSVPETSKGVAFINVEGYHLSYWQYIVPQDRHCTGVYAVQYNGRQGRRTAHHLLTAQPVTWVL